MKHIPLFIFVAFAVKILLLIPTLQDVAALAVAGALSFGVHLTHKDKHLASLSKTILSLEEGQAEMRVDIEAAKNYVTGMKLRNSNGR